MEAQAESDIDIIKAISKEFGVNVVVLDATDLEHVIEVDFKSDKMSDNIYLLKFKKNEAIEFNSLFQIDRYNQLEGRFEPMRLTAVSSSVCVSSQRNECSPRKNGCFTRYH